jgi:hypothetical protein
MQIIVNMKEKRITIEIGEWKLEELSYCYG